MAILIAYYSRAGENYFGGSYRRIPVGNTRRVAEQLASLTGGDLLELRQARPYSDDYRTCVAQARADWQQSVRPELLGDRLGEGNIIAPPAAQVGHQV